jgi:hypothetical protein
MDYRRQKAFTFPPMTRTFPPQWTVRLGKPMVSAVAIARAQRLLFPASDRGVFGI